jgi:hypothetical protein
VARSSSQLGARSSGTGNALPTIAAATPFKPELPQLPAIAVAPQFQPALPQLPQPDLARNVEVSGVIQVGNLTQAIVKAPNEPGSRYVKVGQRLSNGQVLVKRIEMNDSFPVVVLEQYGIEVPIKVGDKPSGTPTVGQPGQP